MGAVAKAARAGGAKTIGVIPEQLVKIEFADHDSDVLHIVKDMRERKGMIEELSDAFVVLPGGDLGRAISKVPQQTNCYFGSI